MAPFCSRWWQLVPFHSFLIILDLYSSFYFTGFVLL